MRHTISYGRMSFSSSLSYHFTKMMFRAVILAVVLHCLRGKLTNTTFTVQNTPVPCATIEHVNSTSRLGCARTCEDWAGGFCTAFGVFRQNKTCEICLLGFSSGQTMGADVIYFVDRGLPPSKYFYNHYKRITNTAFRAKVYPTKYIN